MTFRQRVRQFLSRHFEVRQTPNHLFDRPAQPRLRVTVGTFACGRCPAEFVSMGELRAHECPDGKAA